MHFAALTLLGLVCTEHNQHSSQITTRSRIPGILIFGPSLKFGQPNKYIRIPKPLSSTLLENTAVFVRLSFPACVRRFPQPQYVVSVLIISLTLNNFLPSNCSETEGVWGGSSRPENCPVDSFQQRTGGSPGQISFLQNPVNPLSGPLFTHSVYLQSPETAPSPLPAAFLPPSLSPFHSCYLSGLLPAESLPL